MTTPQDQTGGLKSDRLAYLWLIVGIILFLVSNGRWIIPLATWLYPVFIIRFLRTKKGFLPTLICAIAYIIVYCLMWQELLPLPGVLYYVVVGGIGLLFFLPFLIDKLISPRLQGFLSTLVFPLAYTAIEYIGFSFNPYGTWGSLAYTQYGNLPLMQIASITGIYGLTFLVTWFGSVVNWIWEQEFNWSKIGRGVITYVSVVLAVLLFGGVYLVFASPKSDEVRVAGVQTNLHETIFESESQSEEDSGIDWDSLLSKHRTIMDELFPKSEVAAKSGAKFVAWAEVDVITDDEPALIERGKQLALQEQIYLVMAYAKLLRTDPTPLAENKVVIVGPTGEVLLDYKKARPVPGSEAAWTQKGDGEIIVFDTPYGKVTAIICFENDFPAFTRKAGKAEADILFDPSGDWEAIDPYHTNMKAYRAIENGLSWVRTTRFGLSGAYDYQGRPLTTMDYFKTQDKVFTAHIPTKGITTIYSQIGDVFAWLCVAGFIVVFVMAIIRKKKSDVA